MFCLGSATDWKRAGVTLETAAGLVMKFLVWPGYSGGCLALTDYGRAAGAVAGPMRRPPKYRDSHDSA
jgi:hypothetical protein